MSDPVLNLGGDVIAAIQKNLPSVTVGVLTDRLKKAAEDEQKVERLGMILAQANDAAGKNIARIQELEALEKRHGDLLKREKDVAERERLQELALAQERLAMQNERIKAVEGLVSAVFRNKTLIETVNRTVPVERASGGGWIETHSSNESKTVSET